MGDAENGGLREGYCEVFLSGFLRGLIVTWVSFLWLRVINERASLAGDGNLWELICRIRICWDFRVHAIYPLMKMGYFLR